MCCGTLRGRRSTMSPTCFGRRTSRSSARLSMTRRRRRTTSSLPSSCCGTPTSRPAVSCRAVRTRERRSSWGTRGSRYSPSAMTPSPSRAAFTTPTTSGTCGIRKWRRSTCTRRRTRGRTCRPRSRSTRSRVTSTSCCSSPRGADPPTRAFSTRRRRRC